MACRLQKTTCYDATTSYSRHVIDQHDQLSSSSPLLELEVELESGLATNLHIPPFSLTFTSFLWCLSHDFRGRILQKPCCNDKSAAFKSHGIQWSDLQTCFLLSPAKKNPCSLLQQPKWRKKIKIVVLWSLGLFFVPTCIGHAGNG